MTTTKTSAVKDTDTVQVWTYETIVSAGHDWGRIATKTTETLDFDRHTATTHTVGTHEGEPVDRYDHYPIHESATPESAAAYRRANGYTRIK